MQIKGKLISEYDSYYASNQTMSSFLRTIRSKNTKKLGTKFLDWRAFKNDTKPSSLDVFHVETKDDDNKSIIIIVKFVSYHKKQSINKDIS